MLMCKEYIKKTMTKDVLISDASYRQRLLEQRLLENIKEKALELETTRTLSSGKVSTFYIDGKQVTLDPEGAFLTAQVLFGALKSVNFDAVGGLTLGADPIVASLAFLSYLNEKPMNTFIVRKEPKTHGTMKLIEGKLSKGDRVVIVDDVATTGNSILRAIDAVRQEDCEIAKIIVLVDRQEGAKERFKNLGYDFEPIFTKEDLEGD